MVAGRAIHNWPFNLQDPKDQANQHVDGPRRHNRSSVGGDNKRDFGEIQGNQSPRRKLHLEETGQTIGHGNEIRRERDSR